MKIISILFFLLCSLISITQESIEKKVNSRLIDLHKIGGNDEYFEGFERLKNQIGDAQIVMLGEQSHSDATTFETKIKLIKYLHQEMDFEILAFESGIYDCHKAWSMIQNGHNVKDASAKAITTIWSTLEELNPLYDYIEQHLKQDKPLMLTGFDSQIYSRLAADYFAEDLIDYLANFDDADLFQDNIKQLGLFINKTKNGKKIKKKIAVENIAFLQKLVGIIEHKQKDDLSDFWIQSLKSLEVFISDTKLKTDNRDKQMAENLVWLKERYPNKKIICWGATSHFLYNSSLIQMKNKLIQKVAGNYYHNHSMMGDYIKEKYGDDIYTIGFIAHEGSFGIGRTREIELPSKNSLEYLIGKSENDNYFLSLKDISLAGYLTRPLGHQNMTTDIAKVMDGVIFNRHMRRPYTDWEFHFYVVGENYLSKKKTERFIQASRTRKQNEKSKNKM